MNSSLLPQFFTLYWTLPEDVRQRARLRNPPWKGIGVGIFPKNEPTPIGREK
jgi:hypothetical protein